jgi:hypothetical protein
MDHDRGTVRQELTAILRDAEAKKRDEGSDAHERAYQQGRADALRVALAVVGGEGEEWTAARIDVAAVRMDELTAAIWALHILTEIDYDVYKRVKARLEQRHPEAWPAFEFRVMHDWSAKALVYRIRKQEEAQRAGKEHAS